MASSALLGNLGQVSPCTILQVLEKPNLTTQSSSHLEKGSRVLHQRRKCITLGSKIWGSNVKEVTRASSHFRKLHSWKLRAELGEEEEEKKRSSTSTAVEEPKDEKPSAGTDKKQELDWKKDDDVKRFLSNPSIETLLKVEAKRAEQRLKELETQEQGNIFNKLFADLRRSNLKKEKDRLDKAQQTFKALDLNEAMHIRERGSSTNIFVST